MKDTTNMLLLSGWNTQHKSSAPVPSSITRIHFPAATSHKRAVPSNDTDNIMSLDRDQPKSTRFKH